MAQVEPGLQNPKPIHLANNVIALALVVVALIFFAVGWYTGKHQNGSKTVTTAQTVNSGMATYSNQQYGFQLSYPESWNKPSFATTSVNGGKSYTLQFFKKDSSGKLQYYILLSLVSDSAKAMNAANIKDLIKNNSAALLVNDQSSFAIVASNPGQKSSSLSAYQVVSLNKIGVTSASLTYQITGGSATCPQNKFAQNSGGACIERSDYNTANTVLKSIKSL